MKVTPESFTRLLFFNQPACLNHFITHDNIPRNFPGEHTNKSVYCINKKWPRPAACLLRSEVTVIILTSSSSSLAGSSSSSSNDSVFTTSKQLERPCRHYPVGNVFFSFYILSLVAVYVDVCVYAYALAFGSDCVITKSAGHCPLVSIPS